MVEVLGRVMILVFLATARYATRERLEVEIVRNAPRLLTRGLASDHLIRLWNVRELHSEVEMRKTTGRKTIAIIVLVGRVDEVSGVPFIKENRIRRDSPVLHGVNLFRDSSAGVGGPLTWLVTPGGDGPAIADVVSTLPVLEKKGLPHAQGYTVDVHADGEVQWNVEDVLRRGASDEPVPEIEEIVVALPEHDVLLVVTEGVAGGAGVGFEDRGVERCGQHLRRKPLRPKPLEERTRNLGAHG